jgi:hypothetical protein
MMKVQTWRVAWWRGNDRLDVAYVDAPTKILAKLAIAHDRADLMLRNRAAERVTYQACRERWSRR